MTECSLCAIVMSILIAATMALEGEAWHAAHAWGL